MSNPGKEHVVKLVENYNRMVWGKKERNTKEVLLVILWETLCHLLKGSHSGHR